MANNMARDSGICLGLADSTTSREPIFARRTRNYIVSVVWSVEWFLCIPHSLPPLDQQCLRPQGMITCWRSSPNLLLRDMLIPRVVSAAVRNNGIRRSWIMPQLQLAASLTRDYVFVVSGYLRRTPTYDVRSPHRNCENKFIQVNIFQQRNEQS